MKSQPSQIIFIPLAGSIPGFKWKACRGSIQGLGLTKEEAQEDLEFEEERIMNRDDDANL